MVSRYRVTLVLVLAAGILIGCVADNISDDSAAPAQPASAASRTQWEYQTVGMQGHGAARLNAYGVDGWELVLLHDSGTAYFKRPK